MDSDRRPSPTVIPMRMSRSPVLLDRIPPAEAWLAARGYDPDFGARPLRRVLQREVGDHLAMLLLQGDFESGDTITVDVDGDKLTFR